MLIRDLLMITEASTPRRAWEGKLKRIDKLFSWMYEKGILTATEKKQKDSIFRQYYRFFNDGDFPAALRSQGLSQQDLKYGGPAAKEKIEKALETYLETFIKKILAKYMSKIDRTEFRYDTLIKELKAVQGVADDNDFYGLLNYWLKTVKIADSKIVELAGTLKAPHDALRKLVNAADPSKKSMVLSYARTEMKDAKTWTPEMESVFKQAAVASRNISKFIGDVITGTEKLLAELKSSK